MNQSIKSMFCSSTKYDGKLTVNLKIFKTHQELNFKITKQSNDQTKFKVEGRNSKLGQASKNNINDQD